MAVGVVFTGSGITAMAAESVIELEERIADGNQMEFIHISDEELSENTIPEETMNAMSGRFGRIMESGIAPYADEEDTTNTNPNYAISVANENENEVRWYTFTLMVRVT